MSQYIEKMLQVTKEIDELRRQYDAEKRARAAVYAELVAAALQEAVEKTGVHDAKFNQIQNCDGDYDTFVLSIGVRMEEDGDWEDLRSNVLDQERKNVFIEILRAVQRTGRYLDTECEIYASTSV